MRALAWVVVAVFSLPAYSSAPFGYAQGSPVQSRGAQSSTPAPQAPAPQTPVFRTGIDLLTVDVTVTDSDGRQVTDLGMQDFVIEVDGKERQVVSAEYMRMSEEPMPQPAQRPAATVAPPEQTYFSTNSVARASGRVILLLIDQGNIRAGMARGVMRSAVRFVDGLQASDRVALVAIPGPGAVVDFTTDHEKIREGMLTITGTQHPFQNRFNISLTEAIAAVEHSDAVLVARLMARECAFGLPAELERCEREVEQEASEIVTQERQQSQASVRAMREVLKSLGAIEGPKSVIYISEGLMLEGLTGDMDDIAAIAADVRATLDVMLLDVPAIDASTRDRPSTPREDRGLQVQGLESLAGLARGSLHRVSGTADLACQRIMRALAGYYLLGVEATPADRDGKRHRISVKTKRRGLQMNSRRGFLAPLGPAAKTPTEAITRALRSPLTMTEIPMRMATWTYHDETSGRARVLVAVEIERLADQPLDYTTGLIVVDSSNKVVTNVIEPRTLVAASGDDTVAVFAGAVALDPGKYLMRFAVADSNGRIASVERRLDAWQMSANELTIGDLLIAPPPESGATLQPTVEPRVQGHMAALLEVYATTPSQMDGLEATLDVLTNESSAPVATMRMREGDIARPGALQAHVDTSALPPGRYLARATIRQGGTVRGHLLRPLRVLPPSATASAVPVAGGRAAPAELIAALTSDLSPLAPQELLTPQMLSAILAAAERGRASGTKNAFQEARGGRLGPAALAALDGGDQPLAAFLKGLDFFGQNQPARAAQQFQSAMQASPQFAPARLYLGASLAQGTRYREAASLLQSVPLDLVPDGTPARLAGETWLKAGEATLAAEALERAAQGPSNDWRTARLLGIAYAVSNRCDEAITVLAPQLDSHGTDHAALLAGIYSAYRRHLTPDGSSTLAADRASAVKWAGAYKAANGSLQPLVASWIQFLQQQK
jgi:VWFA-related protein